MQAALARMTLHDHFDCLVTAEDELETISQRLLTASIKLGRAPKFCVYFDSSPRGITAAHNCTLKAVAVQVRVICGPLLLRDWVFCSNNQMTDARHDENWTAARRHCNTPWYVMCR